MGHVVFREESWGPEVAALDPAPAPSYPDSTRLDPGHAAAHAANAREEAEELVCRWCGGELAEGVSLAGARRCKVCGQGTRAIDVLGPAPEEAVEPLGCTLTAGCGAPCVLSPGHAPPCVGSCGSDCPA